MHNDGEYYYYYINLYKIIIPFRSICFKVIEHILIYSFHVRKFVNLCCFHLGCYISFSVLYTFGTLLHYIVTNISHDIVSGKHDVSLCMIVLVFPDDFIAVDKPYGLPSHGELDLKLFIITLGQWKIWDLFSFTVIMIL